MSQPTPPVAIYPATATTQTTARQSWLDPISFSGEARSHRMPQIGKARNRGSVSKKNAAPDHATLPVIWKTTNGTRKRRV